MLHQVGVSFDLYYDARKHKIKMERNVLTLFAPAMAHHRSVYFVPYPIKGLSLSYFLLRAFGHIISLQYQDLNLRPLEYDAGIQCAVVQAADK